jgi:peroxiredoxin/tetratricopeptide (TPR) repeat protein
MIRRTFASAVLLSCAFLASAQPTPKMGHSAHGSAFDTGLRSRPWKMQGLGPAPFKITTKNPEVQQWFNQGNALMHNFWFEEAERSFRWCLKLEPENPMVYWGLAYSGFNWFVSYNPGPGKFDRYREFLKKAVQFKHNASPRERMYIETWDRAFAKGSTVPDEVIARGMQEIVLQYPDDIEAKALLAFYNIGKGSAFANQLIVDEILRRNPNHPGAHHASIHNWDSSNPEQALRSCAGYAKSSPGSGHALHMPGHVYTKVGKWHEAAWAMDAATRFELKYMNERLALPFETWNFAHNRNYLSYIQEQLGMEQAALTGARDLLRAPKDPDYNPEEADYYWEGMTALTRCLMKFERWDLIIKPGEIPWGKSGMAKDMRVGCEAIAYAALGNAAAANERLQSIKDDAKKQAKDKPISAFDQMLISEIEGRLLIAQNDFDGGIKALREAAKLEDDRSYGGDPPGTPHTLWRVIGDAYRKHGDHKLAIDAYERALKKEPMDGFVLSGLAASSKAAGQLEEAKAYAAQFASVWSSPDPGLPWTEMVASLSLDAKPPRNARAYVPAKLDSMGPSNWQPFAAPALDVRDADGKRVTLADYRGKNVVLVFYLSDQCAHCMEQLRAISAKKDDFGKANAVVLAVCNAVENTAPMEGVRLLRDKDHANARRYASFDDFEDMELHSTILIDGEGRVRWKRTGGDPFSKVDFLLSELKKF